jgi:hypothetical protein
MWGGGVQIDLMDNTTWGYNALMLAAQYDHQDVARMLIDAGADTSLLTSTDGVEENNWSNIMVAAWRGDDEVRRACGSLQLAPTRAVSGLARRWQPQPQRSRCHQPQRPAWHACDVDVCVRVVALTRQRLHTWPDHAHLPRRIHRASEYRCRLPPHDPAARGGVTRPLQSGADFDCRRRRRGRCGLRPHDTAAPRGERRPLQLSRGKLCACGRCVSPLGGCPRTICGLTRALHGWCTLQSLMAAGADASLEDDLGNTAYDYALTGEHRAIMAALAVNS